MAVVTTRLANGGTGVRGSVLRVYQARERFILTAPMRRKLRGWPRFRDEEAEAQRHCTATRGGALMGTRTEKNPGV